MPTESELADLEAAYELVCESITETQSQLQALNEVEADLQNLKFALGTEITMCQQDIEGFIPAEERSIEYCMAELESDLEAEEAYGKAKDAKVKDLQKALKA